MKRCGYFLIIVALLTVGISTRAKADELTGWNPTGNDYVATCSGDPNVYSITACYAYVHGTLGGFVTGAIWQLPTGYGIVHSLCVPDGVTNEQVRKVILSYADKHPEFLHVDAANFIAAAIKDAWGWSSKDHPCP
jgi:hypothetical protein